MQRMPVQSSNIASVGYDPETNILEIEFTTGAVYDYPGVPQAKYDEMLMAPSVGRYFAAEIKKQYQGSRVS